MLYLKAKLSELRQTPREFFTSAYYWKYKKTYNPVADVEQWMDGVIPLHVQEFIKDIQKDEQSSK